MTHRSSMPAYIVADLSAPLILWYPPRAGRWILLPYGEWSVEIAGVSVDGCDVDYDSNGALTIDIPDSVQEDDLIKLRTLPMKRENAFRVTACKAPLISLEFARCISKNFGSAPRVDGVNGLLDTQPGYRITLRHETIPLFAPDPQES